MSQMPESPATAPIPVQLSEPEFIAFIFPHLSMPRRGPKCKLGYHRVFNLILWVLYTGMQWKCLPVPEAGDGTAVIHYTTVYKVFAKWSDDGSLRKRRSQKARSSPVRRKWPLENGRFRRLVPARMTRLHRSTVRFGTLPRWLMRWGTSTPRPAASRNITWIRRCPA